MGKKFNFFKEAVKNYKTSGTVAPSSKYLAKKMLREIDFSTAKVIIELGPGNGAITNTILNEIEPNTVLICFEINDAFYKELKKIKHPQLIVIKASAENMRGEIKKLGYNEVNYIVSSLPLTIIPKEVSHNILQESYLLLNTKGIFIQYQYSLTYYKKLKGVFGDNIQLSFEPLNFPPAFIYNCVKNSILARERT
ncbi:rRNA adenine N-6-methyltransferase family protein [Tenacibaculum sp. HL-MS23]|uniref:class I SAM-dependent methyltransferase n=1 Tax=Tenacibaculum TaxID=104267 RepID=UPI002106746B|nr:MULTISPECIES: rRNA adenine N-6-methyltransferase family protein [Tenacibaculum]WNW01314.1 rRNA adenine N-6-methyltransferase family protein [Tenacibaculum sp. HL-MS23]